MSEPRKKQSARVERPVAEEQIPISGALEDLLPREELEKFSTLQLLDFIVSQLPPRHPVLMDMVYLRERISNLEEMNDEARQALEQFDEVVSKLRAPAYRVGTLLGLDEDNLAHVCLAGTDYICRVDPQIPIASLQVGQRVFCNEAFAVVQSGGFDRNGPIVRIDELLSDGRLRIGQDSGLMPLVVGRSALLAKEKLKPGLDIRLDANQRVGLEVIGVGKRIERSLESVAEIPWSAIGGQDEAVQAIRDTIELPLLHRDLFQKFEHRVPKGFLLYGPPGCGKTLLGKATAFNLRQQVKKNSGIDHPEFFLHVKGPELLNMWVGESARQIRDLFTQCRERAKEGALAFLFIDEAESILGTRHGGRFNSMSSTVVPMFCTEMDGFEVLDNVVVILASNRADLIDPAILRPGRIDRKIGVKRPDLKGATSIYEIYLHDGLPLESDTAELASKIAEKHYARTPENEFLEVIFRSGRRELLYRGDLASGAVIAGIVERAKGHAIRRAIEKEVDTSLNLEDLNKALDSEYAENELFPSNDITEDWLRLTDFDPGNVIKLGPVSKAGANPSTSTII